jgi:hypothetical protein
MRMTNGRLMLIAPHTQIWETNMDRVYAYSSDVGFTPSVKIVQTRKRSRHAYGGATRGRLRRMRSSQTYPSSGSSTADRPRQSDMSLPRSAKA